VTLRERGEFLHQYIDLLLNERVNEAEGFRHAVAPSEPREARGRERWVINKLRALCAWYSKGIDGGSHLRVRINTATSITELRAIVDEFFLEVQALAVV
jgi:tRNA-dihydrouridine synthase